MRKIRIVGLCLAGVAAILGLYMLIHPHPSPSQGKMWWNIVKVFWYVGWGLAIMTQLIELRRIRAGTRSTHGDEDK